MPFHGKQLYRTRSKTCRKKSAHIQPSCNQLCIPCQQTRLVLCNKDCCHFWLIPHTTDHKDPLVRKYLAAIYWKIHHTDLKGFIEIRHQLLVVIHRSISAPFSPLFNRKCMAGFQVGKIIIWQIGTQVQQLVGNTIVFVITCQRNLGLHDSSDRLKPQRACHNQLPADAGTWITHPVIQRTK